MNPLQELVELDRNAREFGFKWPDQFMILDQIILESQEIREDLENVSDREKIHEEIGDLLHAVISLCDYSGFDIEETLKKANIKFSNRMESLKKIVKNQNLEDLNGQTIETIITLWNEAKKNDKS